jgi:hypothetical protein
MASSGERKGEQFLEPGIVAAEVEDGGMIDMPPGSEETSEDSFSCL